MSFHALLAHFFLVLSNIPLSGWTTVYLPTYPLEGISDAFDNYDESCSEHCVRGFVWTRFHLPWGSTEGRGRWIAWLRGC